MAQYKPEVYPGHPDIIVHTNGPVREDCRRGQHAPQLRQEEHHHLQGDPDDCQAPAYQSILLAVSSTILVS